MISLGGAIITLLFTLLFGGLYVFPSGASDSSLVTSPEDNLDNEITMTPAPAPTQPISDTPRPKRRLPDIPLFTGKRNEYKVWALNAC